MKIHMNPIRSIFSGVLLPVSFTRKQQTTLTFADSNTKSDISTNLALLTPHGGEWVKCSSVCIPSGWCACARQHYLKSIMTIKYGALLNERYFLQMRSLDGEEWRISSRRQPPLARGIVSKYRRSLPLALVSQAWIFVKFAWKLLGIIYLT